MSEISLDDAYTEVAETEVETVETTETETEEVEAEAETETEDSTTESKQETEVEKPEKESWTFSQAMDEREKRQKFETENIELRKQLEGQNRTDDISVFEDEKGFRDQLKTESQQELANAMMNMSQSYAERDLGKEKVDAAVDWFKTEGPKSPHMMNRFQNSTLQFHEIVQMHSEEQSRLDPEAAKAEMKAEIIAELKAESDESSEKTEEKREAITPSLASKRSTGKDSAATADDMEDMLGA